MSDEITPEELAGLLDEEEPVRVVDIRSPAAFERGHIPDSENVPFGELPQHVEQFADAEHIVTVCPHGKASLQALQLLRSAEPVDDARVESLDGGLEAWDGPLDATEHGAAADRTSDDNAADGAVPSGNGTDAPF
ncbi:rhodanese-related sulfurtransferase [Halococcus morrhuae DSM 1307]|uniref:Rhodanese-related sulfurtransferase n=1 Tax=Halococcus morrhuae DSM 1307 TaxID=931277 RepID=M0MMC3_HALMO|nr:rhodanese-like domain-containing protein [Halococcus morrhuae]EMA45580.1 rhodanese-related sulfurtransferase [Halococcus morrhuae DSM 1307]